MWFRLTGDERLGRCAADGCGGQPTWRLEAGGVGSNYCSGCKGQIDFTMAAAADEEKHGGDCNAGALSADPNDI